MILIQLHHQFKTHTEFVAQQDISANSPKEALNKFKEFLAEMQKAHPPPENARWMACTEESEHFIKAHANRHTI